MPERCLCTRSGKNYYSPRRITTVHRCKDSENTDYYRLKNYKILKTHAEPKLQSISANKAETRLK